jgi:hypothetical protein
MLEVKRRGSDSQEKVQRLSTDSSDLLFEA